MKHLFFISLLFLVVGGFGQDTLADHRKAIIKLNFLYLSPGVELKLKNSFTFFNQVGFPWNIVGGDGIRTQVIFTPFYYGELRYYHNMKRRIKKGKRTEGFFANYFSLQGHIPLAQPKISVGGAKLTAWSYGGIHYGLQRKFLKNWYWDINLGYGIGFFGNTVKPGANFFLGLGYTF